MTGTGEKRRPDDGVAVDSSPVLDPAGDAAAVTNLSYDGSPVGYGKPPVASQFKKGQPRPSRSGRKAGSRSRAKIVQETLDEQIEIYQDGKKRRVSKFEAIILKASALAISGNLDALMKFLRMIERYLVEEERTQPIFIESIPGDSGL